MKKVIVLIIFSSSLSIYSQNNVVDYLKLKETLVKAYFEGELMANDTVVDLKNGYYAEANDSKIIRQATIFYNADGTKTFGVTICEWDFACFNYTSNFYNISKLNDSIVFYEDKSIIPQMRISDFIVSTSIKKTLKKYLPKFISYIGKEAKLEDLLLELYEIKYILPQKGTAIKATLEVCDYLPTNEIQINEEDWRIISTDFLTINLYYNKKIKKFELK